MYTLIVWHVTRGTLETWSATRQPGRGQALTRAITQDVNCSLHM
jgi:hypothetical protein